MFTVYYVILGIVAFFIATLALGIILAIPGLYFLGVTNKLLRWLGSGINAFILTKRIVDDDVYKRIRNPMSLGFYPFTLALGFASNSIFILLAVSHVIRRLGFCYRLSHLGYLVGVCSFEIKLKTSRRFLSEIRWF